MSQRIANRSLRDAVAFAITAAAFAVQAHARLGEICLELPAGAGTVSAKIASGCLPTSPRHEGAFDLQVDEDTASITISGGFTQIGQARIGTTDCMGSRTIEEKADAAGPRRYSVLVNGEYRGVLDASDTQFGMRAVRRCFAGRSQRQIPASETVTTYSTSQFSDWIGRNRKKSKNDKPLSASTIGGVAAQLLGGHPESEEGRPSASISFGPARWRGKPWQKLTDRHFIAIRIEEYGYLDDSISGRRTFAAARHDENSGHWYVKGLWRQFMCARGERAGQWTAQPCT